MLKTILSSISSANTAEAIKMFSSGVMLAIAVFTASKTGRKR